MAVRPIRPASPPVPQGTAEIPFQKTGVTAGGTVTMGATAGGVVSIPVLRAGRIVGIGISAGGAPTAGSVTARVQTGSYAAPTDTTLTAVIDALNPSRVTDLGYAGALLVASGDHIRVTLTATADFAPVGAVFTATVYYAPDPKD